MTEERTRAMSPSNTNDAGQALWQACIEQLSQDLPAQQFATWIKPLVCQVADDFSRITLFVPNRSPWTGFGRSMSAASLPFWNPCTGSPSLWS